MGMVFIWIDPFLSSIAITFRGERKLVIASIKLSDCDTILIKCNVHSIYEYYNAKCVYKFNPTHLGFEKGWFGLGWIARLRILIQHTLGLNPFWLGWVVLQG